MGWVILIIIIGIVVFLIVKSKSSAGYKGPTYITDEDEIKSKITGLWSYDSNPDECSVPCYYSQFYDGDKYGYNDCYCTPESRYVPGDLGIRKARATYSISGTTISFVGLDCNDEDVIKLLSAGEQYSTEVQLTNYSLSFTPPGVGKKITFHRSNDN